MASLTACGPSKGPKEPDNSTQEKELTGTWRFISGLGKSDQGEVIYPYGEKLLSMLMYDMQGYMSALLMDPDQVRYYRLSGDTLRITAPPILAHGVEWIFEVVLVRL